MPPRRWSAPTGAAGSRRCRRWQRPRRRRPRELAPTTAIAVEGLERAFDEVLAVQGIDLEVGEGEIYGFLGPNGAGKTTTVRMLTTLLLPTGGRATVAGRDVVGEARSVRASIGAVSYTHLRAHETDSYLVCRL